MAKSLFLLLISNILGLTFGASFLSATDTILPEAPGYDAVQTVTMPEIDENIIEEPSSEPFFEEHYAEAVFLPTNFTVTVATGEIVEYPSYYDVYRTGKFIYAHNTSGLFANLPYLKYGEIFTITEGGLTQSYQVMDIGIYEKSQANGLLNGSRAVTKAVEFEANGYDVSMMTCYGTMFGNGDASHRLVVFANAI